MITIEDFKKKNSNKVRLVGLDLGSKRIGVSICDERQLIATPFKTINKTNNNELIDQLKLIIKCNDINHSSSISKHLRFSTMTKKNPLIREGIFVNIIYVFNAQFLELIINQSS